MEVTKIQPVGTVTTDVKGNTRKGRDKAAGGIYVNKYISMEYNREAEYARGFENGKHIIGWTTYLAGWNGKESLPISTAGSGTPMIDSDGNIVYPETIITYGVSGVKYMVFPTVPQKLTVAFRQGWWNAGQYIGSLRVPSLRVATGGGGAMSFYATRPDAPILGAGIFDHRYTGYQEIYTPAPLDLFQRGMAQLYSAGETWVTPFEAATWEFNYNGYEWK